MGIVFRLIILQIIVLLPMDVWAQSSAPEEVVTDFSTQMVSILKGPIAKLLAAAILLTGVGGLLRGRHTLAVSCGIAFIVLLFVPLLLEHVGGR